MTDSCLDFVLEVGLGVGCCVVLEDGWGLSATVHYGVN